MPDITFTLRTLTPLFVAGADQATAELRAPSFRGLMRYWQRALVGGLVPLSTVREVETAVFGSTERASAVTVRVSAPSHKPVAFNEQLSVRTGGIWRSTGKGYLLWTMARSGQENRGNLKPARWYFPPGTTFRTTLSTRGTDTSGLDQAIAAFWLLTHLGGIGSRSRRCAGSLSIQDLEGSHASPLPFYFGEHAPQDAQVLKYFLEEGLNKVRTITRPALVPAIEHEIAARKLPPGVAEQEITHKKASIGQPLRDPPFDILAPGICRICILQDTQPWSSAETAMTRLGENLQEYRSQIPLSLRKIFGLPLPPLILNKRRASGLLLRVVELQHGRYAGLAVLFKTTGGGVSAKDYHLIDQWIDTFDTVQEVQL
ncbi:MAG TPA: type III-B CRISPR module RAMP protein Cmr1 [Ktedonobacteraceae bacterium]|jgi:CRISPR-associated protein Cmr1